ncbi:hypothetical protein B0T14DRAFT_536783 [Immersiella caudata]|uniref:Uncharacterized protein n=1 Tax=Immersiella caudata TaxID=314043 RepID=A0AA39WZ07_9PEZI|nr:hypothetical protein B0T14DRAFT_536783 [Immersiella caudata]
MAAAASLLLLTNDLCHIANTYASLSPTSPWAHRTMTVRVLKGVEEIVDLYQVHHHLGPEGWYFSGEDGSHPADPLYGFKLLRELYLKADPNFPGSVTVPLLWDKQTHPISYDSRLYPLFIALDRVEQLLSSDRRRHLLGDHITEADVRLYTTLVRFDVVYHPIFQCNLKSIRHDYPAMYLWLRQLYWDGSNENDRSSLTIGAFYKTTAPNFANYAIGYVLGRRFVVFNNQGR